MYFLDVMYGKMTFSPIVIKCIMTPEVQRLREVRLCNINSLCITGSANTNRFEHSLGTAFLASKIVENNKEKFTDHEKELFVIAALLHDVANGPFGHSYEYLMEKNGFIPETGLKNVFTDVVLCGQGIHGYSSPFEEIFFGKLRELNTIFNSSDRQIILDIISGNHKFSKLLSNKIDIDNIDNVFRMAYHMGIKFPLITPIEIVNSIQFDNDEVIYSNNAKKHLEVWCETRKKVYKFLLLNPQEFSGKYMLTEAMDIVFDDTMNNFEYPEIKWYDTDFQLVNKLYQYKEKWISRDAVVYTGINEENIKNIICLKNDDKKEELKKYINSLNINISCDKNKKQKILIISDAYKYIDEGNGEILLFDNNMKFKILGNKLYKTSLTKHNPSSIISRLMTGDLYKCILIIKSSDIEKYDLFINYSNRLDMENEIDILTKNDSTLKNISIGLHPILDINKTERKISIKFQNSESYEEIGNSTRDLLIGVFIKNEPFGLKKDKNLNEKKLSNLKDIVINYLSKILDDNLELVNLYEEVEKYG